MNIYNTTRSIKSSQRTLTSHIFNVVFNKIVTSSLFMKLAYMSKRRIKNIITSHNKHYRLFRSGFNRMARYGIIYPITISFFKQLKCYFFIHFYYPISNQRGHSTVEICPKMYMRTQLTSFNGVEPLSTTCPHLITAYNACQVKNVKKCEKMC